MSVGELQLETGDFILAQGETEIHTDVQSSARIFIVEVPDQAPYATYAAGTRSDMSEGPPPIGPSIPEPTLNFPKTTQ